MNQQLWERVYVIVLLYTAACVVMGFRDGCCWAVITWALGMWLLGLLMQLLTRNR